MILNDNILNKLSDKMGQDVRTPAGATVLALDLDKKYGRNAPSVNTIKRLVGLLPETNTHTSTLNLIADFLGYHTWNVLEQNVWAEDSAFGRSALIIYMDELKEGAVVELAWAPDCRLLIKHDKADLYTVIRSENCKLLSGDNLRLSVLVEKRAFMVDEVVRDGISLGSYHTGAGTAFEFINIKE